MNGHGEFPHDATRLVVFQKAHVPPQSKGAQTWSAIAWWFMAFHSSLHCLQTYYVFGFLAFVLLDPDNHLCRDLHCPGVIMLCRLQFVVALILYLRFFRLRLLLYSVVYFCITLRISDFWPGLL